MLLSTPAIITVVAVLCAAAGVWVTSVRALSRALVPFGGGVLMGVAAFWVLPEMAESLHWVTASLWIASGFATLWVIDKFLYPVCPACSQPHEHEHCQAALHGFGPPLLLAAALHAALDGWSVSAARDGSAHLGASFIFAIAVHKIPEGLALGVIARAALASPRTAFAWCALAESATLLGAFLETELAPYLSHYVLQAMLAVAGGSFLYLGGHAVHGEWRRRGSSAAALMPALTGVAGPTVLRLFRILG